MKTALELVILFNNRWPKIGVTARQKNGYPHATHLCYHGPVSWLAQDLQASALFHSLPAAGLVFLLERQQLVDFRVIDRIVGGGEMQGAP